MRFSQLIAASVLTACANPTDNAKRIGELEARIAAMQVSLDWNSQDISELNERLMEQHDEDAVGVLMLKDGYTAIKTDIGVLLVSWEDIAPLGNGSKVTLKIGNLTSGKPNGVRLQGKWEGNPGGPIDAKITNDLWPGKWNPVTFQISGAPPGEILWISLSIGTDVVGLN